MNCKFTPFIYFSSQEDLKEFFIGIPDTTGVAREGVKEKGTEQQKDSGCNPITRS